MQNGHLLIVAVDGLRASALGAYGNTTFPTPALDRFAAQSALLDFCFAPSVEMPAVYRSLWHSSHPLRESGYATNRPSLPRLFGEHGYDTTLVTDDQSLLEIHGTANFHQAILTPPSLPDVFAAASEVVSRFAADGRLRPQLVWLHARGMYGPWQAPSEWQESLLDEDDPPPLAVSEPPDIILNDSDDPDLPFRCASAYAAEVMLLDRCWKELMAVVDDGQASEWLVMLLGVRGFPLGEHARIGGIDRRLYSEQLHVPWLMRFPDNRGRLSRYDRLTAHLDLLPTLLAWHEQRCAESKQQRAAGETPETDGFRAAGYDLGDGLNLLHLLDGRQPAWRDVLLSASESAAGLRTPGWTLRVDLAAAAAELFVRPDDRWEANDVAARCPEIAAELRAAVTSISLQIQQGHPMPLSLPAAAGTPPTEIDLGSRFARHHPRR